MTYCLCRSRSAWLVLLTLAWLAPPRAARGADTRTAVRLGDDVVPRAQEVRLRLDPALEAYSGSTTIDLEVRRPTAVIRLHAAGETFQSVALAGAAGGSVDSTVTREGDLVRLATAAPLAPGRYRLTIAFTQTFNTRAVALYRVSTGGASYLFTQFENSDARGAFPCFDEPTFKLPWTLAVDVPADDLALGNMSVATEESSGARKTVTFRTTPPLPSYLVALAVGPFETVPIAGLKVPGRVVTIRGQHERAAFAAAMVPRLLGALEAYFGSAYPFDKLDLIAVPEYAFGAMENPGAITFLDSIVLLDPQPSQQARAQLVYVATHELAHMWFGDLVTMRWWNDLWLNESFADWLSNKLAIDLAPERDFDIARADAIDRAMRGDARLHAKPVRLPDDCREEDVAENAGLAYFKGRGVLGMVESWVGPEPFRRGLVAHLQAHAWGNADAHDLGRSLTGATGRDVASVLADFMQQPGLPLLDVRLAGGHVTLAQERFHRANEAPAAETWRVPVTLAFADDAGVHRLSTLLAGPTLTLDLGAHGAVRWIWPDAEAQGYYRWRLSADDLDRLLTARAQLSRAERVALLGNLRALLDAGAVDGGQWVRTLAALATDDDPAVAAAVVGAVAALETPFAQGPAADLYAAFIRRHFGLATPGAEWAPAPGQSAGQEALRVAELDLLGRQGAEKSLRAAARAEARRWLSSEAVAIEPALLPNLLALAATEGDRELLDGYRARLRASTSPAERDALIGGLAAFGDPALAAAALDFALDDAVRGNEAFWLFFRSATNEPGRERAWRWLQSNFSAIRAKIPPPMQVYMPRSIAGCSNERLDGMRALFARQPFPSAEDALDRVGDEVTACQELRRAQAATLEAELRRDAAR